jgi:hypothetical protein
MQLNTLSSLAGDVGRLAPDAPSRLRQFRRLIDTCAAAEASAALRAAAARTPEDAGSLGAVLASADAFLAGVGESGVYDRLREAIKSPEFLALVPQWIRELREVASFTPETGACTIASALELWSWTVKYFLAERHDHSVLDELGEALCPLLAARALALDVAANAWTDRELELPAALSHVHAARAAAAAGAACAELVFGYRRHLEWDADGCETCYSSAQLDDLEALMPGFAGSAGNDVIEADGSHPLKAGPCVRFDGVDSFLRLRNKLDGCLTGSRLAKDRAVSAIETSVVTTPAEVR